MAPTPFQRSLTCLLSVAVLSLGGLAQAQDSDLPEADPPERAARLSYLQGEVSLQPAGEEEWAPAILNRPLTTGDKLWTERAARAEIEVGPAAVRLDADTGFSFLNVDDNTIQMRMTAGVLNVSVRRLDDKEHIEIATPNVAVLILRPGSYRLEVNDAGDQTIVKVNEGAADATGASEDVVVHAGQAVTFTGVDDVVARLDRLGSPDDFDRWAQDRDEYDRRASSSRTAQYVAPDVTGYEDLDDNGTWSSEPEYGYVWTPSRVAVDWAPYRYGRWVWVSPWGWTWIDDARWGYAPFHYGRWAHVRNRWCWVPGPRHVRAVYAPALVVWVGGHGSRISWFPLGPREVYVPWRRHSRHYFDRVNHSNTVIVDRRHIADAYENRVRQARYRNLAVKDAVTSAVRSQFTSGGRIGSHRVRDNDRDVASAVASAAAPRIDPVRESRLGGPARANLRSPPRSIVDRQVVVKRDPPAPVARFARAPRPATADPRAPDRVARRINEQVGEDHSRAAFAQNRPDRPPRADRQPRDDAAIRSPVRDPRSIADRVREDRERQARENQQREGDRPPREVLGRESRDDAPRAQRESAESWRDLQRERQREAQEQHSVRDAAARQIERRQMEQRERAVEHSRDDRAREAPRYDRRPEQPRIERSREPRSEQPRMERRPEAPRVERPREPARTEQPRAERQSPAEVRAQPRESRQQDGNRANRR